MISYATIPPKNAHIGDKLAPEYKAIFLTTTSSTSST